MPPHSSLDHLVITCPTLEAGSAYVESALGATLQPGGEHPRMGTHNQLLRLGERVYLEALATNPRAGDPGRPRWFGLDRLVPGSPPRLAAWVARCDDITAAMAAARAAGFELGIIEAMSRGSFNWMITIPPDGTLPVVGCAPLLIQWSSPGHPAARLPDQGFALAGLEVWVPQPEGLRALLEAIGFVGSVTVTRGLAGLRAFVRAPCGELRTIE